MLEWNYRDDTFLYTCGLDKLKISSILDQNDEFLNVNYDTAVFDEDKNLFIDYIKSKSNFLPYYETEIRLLIVDNCYKFCKATITTEFHSNGKPLSIIATINLK